MLPLTVVIWQLGSEHDLARRIGSQYASKPFTTMTATRGGEVLDGDGTKKII